MKDTLIGAGKKQRVVAEQKVNVLFLSTVLILAFFAYSVPIHRERLPMFQDILIKITGKKDIYVENYKNILDYREDRILIQGKKDRILFTGTGFRIEYFSSECMRIRGCLSAIEYGEPEKSTDR